MQAFVKQGIGGDGLWVNFQLAIFLKNRRSGKTKHLRLIKEAFDIAMGIAKLATVTFIKNDHDFFIFEIANLIAITVGTNGNIELLQGGDNQFVVLLPQLSDQGAGILGGIDTVCFEGIELTHRLGIEITTIHHKQDLFNFRQAHDELTGFEWSQGFSWACGVPDIAILLWVLHTLNNLLYRIDLVGTQHHQTLFNFQDHHVFSQHLGDVLML